MIHFYTIFREFISDLGNSMISLLKILFVSKFNINLPTSTHKKASILGNGPSLNLSLEKDLDFIKQTDIYCVNNFASSIQFLAINPQNYVLLDPAFFLFNPQNNGRDDIQKTIFAIQHTTNWAMKLFVPIKYRNSYLVREITENNPNITFVFFNYTVVKGFAWLRHKIFNLDLGMPQCQNILAASLFLAIRQKYATIYLFGADHSWHEEIRVNQQNELEMKQIHFYDKPENLKHQKILDVRNNQFSKIHSQFYSLYKAFYSYEILKQYADYQDVSVLNASKKTYIDAFQRVEL